MLKPHGDSTYLFLEKNAFTVLAHGNSTSAPIYGRLWRQRLEESWFQ